MSDSVDSNWLDNPVESGDYVLINAYDEIVKNNVQDLMKKGNTCKCEKCFLDVCAIVLNSSRSNYVHFVTTRAGALFAKIPEMGYSNQAEMTVIILDAIRRVGESPMH